jgi:uncharacterized alkaline shock family protein YloU
MMSDGRIKFGSVQVHKEVLAEIVYNATSQIKGVRLKKHGFGQNIGRLFGQNRYPGIQIRLDADNRIIVDVSVFVQYGLNLPMIGQEVQDVVKKALEKSVDVQLKDINVNIKGVERGQR